MLNKMAMFCCVLLSLSLNVVADSKPGEGVVIQALQSPIAEESFQTIGFVTIKSVSMLGLRKREQLSGHRYTQFVSKDKFWHKFLFLKR